MARAQHERDRVRHLPGREARIRADREVGDDHPLGASAAAVDHRSAGAAERVARERRPGAEGDPDERAHGRHAERGPVEPDPLHDGVAHGIDAEEAAALGAGDPDGTAREDDRVDPRLQGDGARRGPGALRVDAPEHARCGVRDPDRVRADRQPAEVRAREGNAAEHTTRRRVELHESRRLECPEPERAGRDGRGQHAGRARRDHAGARIEPGDGIVAADREDAAADRQDVLPRRVRRDAGGARERRREERRPGGGIQLRDGRDDRPDELGIGARAVGHPERALAGSHVDGGRPGADRAGGVAAEVDARQRAVVGVQRPDRSCSACQPDRAGADGIRLPQRAGARVDRNDAVARGGSRGARRGALARQRERQRGCTQREGGGGRRRDANARPAPAWRIGRAVGGTERRIVRQDLALEPVERRRWCHPELDSQPAPRIRERRERVGLTSAAVERDDVRGTQPLAQGMALDQGSDRGQRLARPAEAEQGVGAVLEGVEALVLAATGEGIDAGR